MTLQTASTEDMVVDQHSQVDNCLSFNNHGFALFIFIYLKFSIKLRNNYSIRTFYVYLNKI